MVDASELRPSELPSVADRLKMVSMLLFWFRLLVDFIDCLTSVFRALIALIYLLVCSMTVGSFVV